MLQIFKKKPGRPISLNKVTITKKCLDFYWINGIENKSFNEVIKYAGVSKGSIYRLYGSEDSLQKNVLNEYFKFSIKDRLEFISRTTVKELIMEITSGLITNKLRPCLFYRSKVEKYKLGSKAKRCIEKIESKIQISYVNLIKDDFKIRNMTLTTQEALELADFLINSISTLHILKLNNAPHKILLVFSKKLIKHFT